MSLPHKPTHKTFKPRETPMARGDKGLARTPFTHKPERKRPRRTSRLVSDWRVKHEQGTRKRLIEDLDEVVSLIVRLRDGYRCVMCRSTWEPQAAHLWKRGVHATRWDLDNVWTNCSDCNVRHNTVPEPYMIWVAAKIGEERYDALRCRKDSKRRFADAELMQMLDDLRAMLREMKRAA